MSGIKYLLDTNVVLGILQRHPATMEYVESFAPELEECAYSAITRMELLGFPNITLEEDAAIRRFLGAMHYLPLDNSVENAVIKIRRVSKLKLPDCIIVATAQVNHLTLLSLDIKLRQVASKISENGG